MQYFAHAILSDNSLAFENTEDSCLIAATRKRPSSSEGRHLNIPPFSRHLGFPVLSLTPRCQDPEPRRRRITGEACHRSSGRQTEGMNPDNVSGLLVRVSCSGAAPTMKVVKKIGQLSPTGCGVAGALSDSDVTVLREKDGSVQKKKWRYRKILPLLKAGQQPACQVYLFLSVTFLSFK